MPSSIAGLEHLPGTLTQRIFQRNEFLLKDQKKNDASAFVLYLPTVNLRVEHNPGFALACHIANDFQVPLVVLAVVLDDAHVPSASPASSNAAGKKEPPAPVVFTARRIAFVLEALQDVTQQWEQHGAGVGIRVHGPRCRNPHHLTLARKALAVVTDEPFVHPYRKYVDTLEQALGFARVPLFSVDGSTTVPPIHKLQKKTRDDQGRLVYLDSPKKAWRWEERTRPNRRGQVLGAVKDGHLDAPDLRHKLHTNFFLSDNDDMSPVADALPREWKDPNELAPGRRPWTVAELASTTPKEWVMEWPGIDTNVPPCEQTHGSTRAGLERWENFRDNHLGDYAKLRNQITKPHAVSRMSCYLNYGIVSIFRVVNDVWDSKKGKGAAKFIDECVKWREIGYVHAFANPDYNLATALPRWSTSWLSKQQMNQNPSAGSGSYSLEELALGSTSDDKWNAMQKYLVETGELHNNARMPWGKTMLHWQKNEYSAEEILYQMVYVNDRYALDGLSPPSYAGVLWCFGWCDKPSNKHGEISEKPASKYRQSSSAFEEAKLVLLASSGKSRTSSKKQKPQESSNSADIKQAGIPSPTKRQKSIDSYFKVVA